MSKLASKIFDDLKKSQFQHAIYLLRNNHNKLSSDEYDYLQILLLRLLIRHCQQGFVPTADFCNSISSLPLFIDVERRCNL